MAAHYVLTVPSRGQHVIRCRLSAWNDRVPLPLGEKAFDDVIRKRKNEADEFYKAIIPGKLSSPYKSNPVTLILTTAV